MVAGQTSGQQLNGSLLHSVQQAAIAADRAAEWLIGQCRAVTFEQVQASRRPRPASWQLDWFTTGIPAPRLCALRARLRRQCARARWLGNYFRKEASASIKRHVMEIRQAATPHLSSCRSTAIVHYLSSLYIANRTFTQSQFATIFGGGRNFCTLYKSFLKIDYVGHHY